ncbi:hypothetical protein P3F83_17990 [Mycobacteroides immunogenum]|uniref:hypothetical protein n=1 Tax=Mycobacteroides immunogenum TaxID=83262 RepID=UPI0025B781AA|nr:hypothetical protein [Mycobacteroides immunogenum]WJR32402.1 hypothetical protein P3F83_17990 [Mycobacteroides immunogenum]
MTTLDEFMAINPNAYMAVVDTWRPQTKQFKEAYDDYKRWAGAPAGTEWTGRTANAAYERAATDCHGSDNTDDAAEDIVTLASATITHEVLPPLNNGKTMIENALRAKDQGVSIDQNFDMTYTPPEGMSEETAAKNRQHVEEAERQIKEYVAKWEKGCKTLKGQADTAAQKITGCINPKTALVDGRKILRDAVAPKPGDPPAQPANLYKEMYPKATDPASTQATAATAADPNAPVLGPPSPADKPIKPDPTAGAFTGSLNKMGITEPKSPLDKPAAPDARTMPAPKLDPNTPQGKAAIDKFRSILSTQYPPDQVEAKLSEAIKGAQQDRPMVATPEPGTPERVRQSGGEAFAEAWDKSGRAIDDLVGNNGGDHAKEAWKGVAKGLWDVANPDPVHQVERGIDQAKGAIEEVKSGIDNPKAFIGKHGIEIAAGIATAPVGGEGALLGTEGRALTHGLEDAAPGHHTPPSGPSVDHPVPTVGDHSLPADPGADHHVPINSNGLPADTFNPDAGANYASGNPHYPGRWPPDTPAETWVPGETDRGWKYFNRGDSEWVDYQLQTGGLERTPDGRVPEFMQYDPNTGKAVAFDSFLHRGAQEVYIDGKVGREGMFWQPDSSYWEKRAFSDFGTAQRQLSALPPGAILEWHVSNSQGAAALREMLEQRRIFNVDVIYTPLAP